MSRDGGGDNLQRLARSLHHIVPPGSVDVDVDKSGDDRFPACIDLAPSAR
jgi:hypothetical protein